MLPWKIKWSFNSYGGSFVIPYIKLLHTNCYHVNIFTTDIHLDENQNG